MPTSNRTLFTKLHKVLKKYYKPFMPKELPLLEQMLFAACLSNSSYEKAEQAFESLRASFFDWNEVRVTTIHELMESLEMLPDPKKAAEQVRGVLQQVFEANYTFDLETLRKEKLGVAQKNLTGIKGLTPFVVSFALQQSLGGHCIPLDHAAWEVLYIIGAVPHHTPGKDHSVPGLERTIPKSKGAEFASLLHAFAADLNASPYDPKLQQILVEVTPDSKPRLPKRGVKKPDPPAKPAKSKPAAPAPAEAAKAPEKGTDKGGDKGADKGSDKGKSDKDKAEKGKPVAAKGKLETAKAPEASKDAAKKKLAPPPAKEVKRAPAAAAPSPKKKPEPAAKAPAAKEPAKSAKGKPPAPAAMSKRKPR